MQTRWRLLQLADSGFPAGGSAHSGGLEAAVALGEVSGAAGVEAFAAAALWQAGSFAPQNGVFYNFCQRAIQDPDHEYVFIIDEINRGNLSQIFGELLMLIEADKRGPAFAVPLVYRNPDEPRFYVPQNLYLIGLMNLADRSLAMVDYRQALQCLPKHFHFRA